MSSLGLQPGFGASTSGLWVGMGFGQEICYQQNLLIQKRVTWENHGAHTHIFWATKFCENAFLFFFSLQKKYYFYFILNTINFSNAVQHLFIFIIFIIVFIFLIQFSIQYNYSYYFVE